MLTSATFTAGVLWADDSGTQPLTHIVVTCVDTGSKAVPPRIVPFREKPYRRSNSLPWSTDGYRDRSDSQPTAGGSKRLAIDALSQRERFQSVLPEGAEGIAASRAATTGEVAGVPSSRPGCPGWDDLTAFNRAAPSGQVVDGPASAAKASTRGTGGRIRRPRIRQGPCHLACRFHPAQEACGSAGVP